MKPNVLTAAVLLAATAAFAGTTAQAADTGKTEMCYGVAKAGANDCKSASHACAGHAKMDKDPASFIVVPAGTCEKLAGGSLKPMKG